MNDLPPDLSRLRVLETWLQITLTRVREQIALAEQRATQQQRAIAPPSPDWVVQLSVVAKGSPSPFTLVGAEAPAAALVPSIGTKPCAP